VTAAREEKDLVAQATRRTNGVDPLSMAYRVAAALNAPDVARTVDAGFFWVTAVTSDGQIVVANSYALGYIPAGVYLPESVRLVSADDAIPVEIRARWATYPFVALQGWRAHHDVELRKVIATPQQFQGFDPGVSKKELEREDIPQSGKMAGRSRLEVVAPALAARLAATGDLRLFELLPAAPVDTNPPVDKRDTLWFRQQRHLMSSDAERGTEHLRDFVAYARHIQELAVRLACTAVHAVEQRAAVADYLYWHYLDGLIDGALTGSKVP
jgi:hypothetical protein